MFEEATPAELIELITGSGHEESRLMARRMAAVWQLLLERMQDYETDPNPDYSSVTGFQRATAEVAAALNLSGRAASFMVSHAEALAMRLPKVAAVLADGKTDWRTVELIIVRTELVGSEINAIDESLAARIVNWRCWSRRRIINAVDAAVHAADPEAARERRMAAEERDRHVSVTPLPEGMARISGTVAATAAAAFDKRLSDMATALCADDPRTLIQRRADALAALGEGRALICECERPNCPARPEQAAAPGVLINVVASEDTLCGRSQQPGYLSGYGVIDADQVRELAEEAALRMVHSTTTEAQALCYQPSAALERFIRSRDLTCRFPGCDVRAEFCDIDHTVPFNHADPAAGGLTVPWNLKCVCRQHHRLKTFVCGRDGWQDEQLPDGTIVWISPTGKSYRTTPGGADLFPQFGRPACTAPRPQRRNHAKERAARIARARKHNREQKPLNNEHRRVLREMKREIDGRKFRNHARRMKFIFKGSRPSSSPFCPWIDDPLEPEDLPLGWKPPPKPPPPPDDPPF
ncbi:MAG TPA: DUF222 domain-containing protein [Mycobacterium sp.]|nr:DUF222 domain-containing protein [Mycobacterium sp.]